MLYYEPREKKSEVIMELLQYTVMRRSRNVTSANWVAELTA
jgi:hypothetical protein